MEIILRYKYLLIGVIAAVIFIVFFIIGINENTQEEISIIKEEKVEESINIYVDIKGAIKNPGVKEIKKGSRVIDLINFSNGLTENADTSNINLSKVLIDEEVIIIDTKEEILEQKEKNLEAGKVSINRATQKELESLPGIGEAKAKSIIEFRNKNNFTKLEDIKKVPGIGERIYDRIKTLITL